MYCTVRKADCRICLQASALKRLKMRKAWDMSSRKSVPHFLQGLEIFCGKIWGKFWASLSLNPAKGEEVSRIILAGLERRREQAQFRLVAWLIRDLQFLCFLSLLVNATGLGAPVVERLVFATSIAIEALRRILAIWVEKFPMQCL